MRYMSGASGWRLPSFLTRILPDIGLGLSLKRGATIIVRGLGRANGCGN